MQIAFWGEQPGSGTTSSMLACAGMLSVLYPRLPVTLHTVNAARARAGRHCGNRHKSTLANIHSGIRFRLVDCGSGLDEVRYRILRQSDYIVVNLRQEEQQLAHFFLEEAFLMQNSLVLISNYYQASRFNLEYIRHMYRIEPSRLGAISCNSEFERAIAQGRIPFFVKQAWRDCRNGRNQRFLEELTGVTYSLLRGVERECGVTLPFAAWKTEHKEDIILWNR